MIKKLLTNDPWYSDNTIYMTIHGSNCYGTNIETSDMDYRGVVIPPKEILYGYIQNFESYVQKEPDLVLFDIRKFFKLASVCNPNVIEILYTNPKHHVFVNPVGQMLLDNKGAFLSKKAKHTFSGYAVSQLRRIKRHRDWLLHPVTVKPTRESVGLAETPLIKKDQLAAINSAIQKQLDKWNWLTLDEVDADIRQDIKTQFETMLCELGQWHWADIDDKSWYSAVKQIGLDDNFIEILSKERVYAGKVKDWEQYQGWLKSRNPDRAQMEKDFGFDGKHGLHLVRLMRMCKELLETGKVNVDRSGIDAEDLISIRRGAWSYDDLIEYAEKMEADVNSLYLTCDKLPDKPNNKLLNKLCIDMTNKFLESR